MALYQDVVHKPLQQWAKTKRDGVQKEAKKFLELCKVAEDEDAPVDMIMQQVVGS